jgi:hypothetical protein
MDNLGRVGTLSLGGANLQTASTEATHRESEGRSPRKYPA